MPTVTDAPDTLQSAELVSDVISRPKALTSLEGLSVAPLKRTRDAARLSTRARALGFVRTNPHAPARDARNPRPAQDSQHPKIFCRAAR